MSLSSQDIAEQHRQARQFTQVTLGLTALAALAVAAIINHTAIGSPLTAEARQIATWSFVGLAALDAALLCTWHTIIRWISQHVR